MSLLAYEDRFSSLRLNTRSQSKHGALEKSPHKVAMLLSVISLIAEKHITENVIRYDAALKSEFSNQFQRLAALNDRDNPHLPFFHLRSSGFWHHQVKAGKNESYSRLNTASGNGAIEENISYAHLDNELFELLNNAVARELLKTALQQNLSPITRREILDLGNDWTWLECEALVHDYFKMLKSELSGEKYNKSAHRRALLPLLNKRTERSIESKHRNVSAVLLQMGQPYIQGYKPLPHYQAQLNQVVLAYIAGHAVDLDTITATADDPLHNAVETADFENAFDPDIPERLMQIKEPTRKYLAHKPNYSERENNNRNLGAKGEAYVVRFERDRLIKLGRPDLANEVEHKSITEGDGLGYDVLSFNHLKDEERYIEVKTTNSGKHQPFFVSDNELAFSKEYADNYSLYRVYNFRAKTRLFELPGHINDHVHLLPKNYKAIFSSH